YNEVSSNGGLYNGHDSYAVGGQIGGRLQLTKWWTMTPTFLVMNWRYPDAILNSSFFSTQATSTNNVNIIDPSSGKPASFPITGEGPGCASVGSSGLLSSQSCVFAANGLTNATFVDPNTGKLRFLSGYLYADVIVNNTFKTMWSRLPVNLLAEYEN